MSVPFFRVKSFSVPLRTFSSSSFSPGVHAGSCSGPREPIAWPRRLSGDTKRYDSHLARFSSMTAHPLTIGLHDPTPPEAAPRCDVLGVGVSAVNLPQAVRTIE